MATIRKLRSVTNPTPAPSPEPSGPAPDEFTGDDGAMTVPTGTAESTAVATAPSASAVAVTGPRNSVIQADGVEGEWDQSDIKLPQLKIVQGSGKLSQKFNTGTVLLGDDVLLDAPDLRNPRPGDFFRFVPVGLRKQFRENLPFDESGEQMPRTVDTLEEVYALGGTTEYGPDGGRPSWSKAARLILLVEQPESGAGSGHPNFTLELDGKLYAPAVYYCTGTSFRKAGQLIFNALATSLITTRTGADGKPERGPNGLPVRVPCLEKLAWEWRTTKFPAGDFMVWGPDLRLTRFETGSDLRLQAATLRGC